MTRTQFNYHDIGTRRALQKHRRELRKDEQALSELRYQIEDAILAEKAATAAATEKEE